MKLYKAKDSFAVREFDGDTVLIPIGEQVFVNNSLITLNESALLLWQALENEMNEAQLIKVLTDEFDVSTEQAATDIDLFLNKLIGAGALEIRG